MDKDLKNILDDLDDKPLEGFNRSKFYNSEYFNHHDFSTPSNTPAANKAKEVDLKNIDFSKYFNNIEDKVETYNEIDYCDKAYVGINIYESGLSSGENIKVIL